MNQLKFCRYTAKCIRKTGADPAAIFLMTNYHRVRNGVLSYAGTLNGKGITLPLIRAKPLLPDDLELHSMLGIVAGAKNPPEALFYLDSFYELLSLGQVKLLVMQATGKSNAKQTRGQGKYARLAGRGLAGGRKS